MNLNQRKELEELLTLSLERQTSQEQVERLNAILDECPDALPHCLDFYSMVACLGQSRDLSEVFINEINGDYDTQLHFLKELAYHEKIAPAVEIPDEEPRHEWLSKTVYPPREKRKISKFQIFTLAISVAAMLFVVLFVKFAPKQQYSIQVATLVDQIDVKWADSATSFRNGDRLWTNQEPVGLAKGVVEIQYDDGVEVLIEGPSVFELERGGVFLEYGRLYSRVSETGFGFRVETPTSRFVDLGTEFGVQADIEGSSELHVYKGKVQLFADSNHETKVGRIVTENEAVRYNANTGNLEPIPTQEKAFVREVDSKTGLIWRGQAHVNLADIVGGGNGFGTGKMNWGIDTRNGRIEMSGSSNLSYTYHSNAVYRSCPSPLIDGVFVPDASEGPVQISSTRLNFAECPDTTGDSADIIQNGSLFTGNRMSSEKAPDHNLGLDGRTLEKPGECLYMHSNKGITFDLEAIRRTIPGLRINRFKSLAGLSDTVLELTETLPRADFWVLVDGRLELKQVGVKPEDRAFDIDIPLTDTDRFLTLVITDSGLMERDWGVFANPILELELK